MTDLLHIQPDTLCPFCSGQVKASLTVWICENGHGVHVEPVP